MSPKEPSEPPLFPDPQTIDSHCLQAIVVDPRRGLLLPSAQSALSRQKRTQSNEHDNIGALTSRVGFWGYIIL